MNVCLSIPQRLVAMHTALGATNIGSAISWLVVATGAAFVVDGRPVLEPFRRTEFA